MSAYFIIPLFLTLASLAGLALVSSGREHLLKRPVTYPVYCYLLFGALNFMILIPFNLASPLFWAYVLVAGSTSFGVFYLGRTGAPHSKTSLFDNIALVWGCIAVAIYIVLVTPLAAFLDDDPYQRAIAIDTREVFDPSAVLLEGDEARFVDSALAAKAVSELMGEEFSLGSRFEFSDASIQQANDRLIWVAPLAPKSVVKWHNNPIAPGYAYVSVNNYGESELVLREDTQIAFGDAGFWFSGNVQRHLYVNGFNDALMTAPRLEIDNEGIPYWIMTRYEYDNYLHLRQPSSVVMVKASDGSIVEHPLDAVPLWVDHIYTEELTEDLLSYTLKYVKGAWNAFFVGDDVTEASKGTFMVYTKEGHAKWYTGLQSTGAQQGTMGFALSDTRTGLVTIYRRAGITEAVAKQVAEGLVQDLGYSSSNPIPHNVNGINTFVSILKDTNGNKQGVALVRYSNRSVAGWGKSLKEAELAYMTSMARLQGKQGVSGGSQLISVTGVVYRITHLNESSYFMLDNREHSGVTFSIAHAKNAHVALSQQGDVIELDVVDLSIDVVPVVKFSNVNLRDRAEPKQL